MNLLTQPFNTGPKGSGAGNGLPLTGGVPNSVLFIDSAGNLKASSTDLTYNDTTKRLQVGSGTTTSVAGMLGYQGNSGFGALWLGATIAGITNDNFALTGNATNLQLNTPGTGGTFTLYFGNTTQKWSQAGTAGAGPTFSMGTATTDVGARWTQTWNNSGVTFTGYNYSITDQAANAGSAAASIHTNWAGGTAGTTSLMSLTKTGALLFADAYLYRGGSLEFYIGSATNNFGGYLKARGLYATPSGTNNLGIAIGQTDGTLQLGASGLLGFGGTTAISALTTNISQASSGVLQIGTSTAGTAGSLSLTNLTTAATSSTGTAAILDGSNVLRPLTSSRAFKKNIKSWAPTASQIGAFLNLPESMYDYEDHSSNVVLDGMRLCTVGEEREGVKGVLGFIAEDIHDAGLAEMLNYDDSGKPYSLREHGLAAYMHAALKNHEARLVKAGF